LPGAPNPSSNGFQSALLQKGFDLAIELAVGVEHDVSVRAGQRKRFSQLLTNDGAPQEHPLGDLRDALAVIQYTGGTTGLPKGAMLTHANLSSACAQYVASSQTVPPSIRFGEERLLVVLPLFHIYSLTVNMLMGIRLGAEIVLHTRFDLETVMKEFEAKKITMFAGVPTMYTAIANHPINVRVSCLKTLKDPLRKTGFPERRCVTLRHQRRLLGDFENDAVPSHQRGNHAVHRD